MKRKIWIFKFFVLIAILVICPMEVTKADDALSDRQILHLLNRTSFGPVAGDIDALRSMGVDRYLRLQLHPETISASPVLQERMRDIPAVNATRAELFRSLERPDVDEGKLSDEEKQALNQSRQKIVQELSEAKILQAAISPAQLQEVMTDFWFNHFNVFFGKNRDRILVDAYEREAIRPHALGKFRDLLGATAHDPAMMVYLDNAENTDPNSVFARRVALRRGKELGINENYAREIMELHTLGVNGGYTQTDVTTLAHILTGWGLARGRDPEEATSFAFDPERHDFGAKVFLGETVRGEGADEVEHVLDILAEHPSTAHHISYQLAQYFLTDDPPEHLVNTLTATFKLTHGDISAVLWTLFHTPEFWDQKYEQSKFKPPFRYVVSMLRASDFVPGGDLKGLQGAIAQMGEPLYRCVTPNGYANTNDQWLNSDALLKRINLSRQFTKFLDTRSAELISTAIRPSISDNTRATLQQTPVNLQAAVLLGSPEFLYY